MAIKHLPPADHIRQLLDYNPDTGLLTWRLRTAEMFSDGYRTAEGNCNQWNSRYAGQPAFTARNARGYHIGNLNAVPYLAHRLIWKMVTGDEPETIDHMDGDTSNNRFANLRSVAFEVNARNRRTRRDAGHGTGIDLTDCRYRPWRALIGFNRKMILLGHFKTKGEAVAARKAAERKYGFYQR